MNNGFFEQLNFLIYVTFAKMQHRQKKITVNHHLSLHTEVSEDCKRKIINFLAFTGVGDVKILF